MALAPLIPVPQGLLEIVKPIIQLRLAESNLEKRSSVENVFEKLVAGYKNHDKAVYVDSVDDPKHCLILGLYEAIVSDERTAAVHLIWSHPSVRGDIAYVRLMMETTVFYAKAHEAVAILGSSWIYGGAESTNAIWERFGFVPQANMYVKLLKD